MIHRLVVGFGLIACSSSSQPREDEAKPVAAPIAIAIAIDAAPIAPIAIDAPPPPVVPIVDTPMKWSDERAALTLAYRRMHSDPDASDLAIEPRVLVLHHTGANTAKSTLYTFEPARLAGRPELQRGGVVNVSAHFLVDRDGTIHRLQPETRYARHCIGLNHTAIGIENVGDDKQWPLTDAQVAANIALVRDLARRFPITHLLGHHEVAGFARHAYYIERDPKYTNQKPDPGAPFMARVRAAVADLKLAGP